MKCYIRVLTRKLGILQKDFPYQLPQQLDMELVLMIILDVVYALYKASCAINIRIKGDKLPCPSELLNLLSF